MLQSVSERFSSHMHLAPTPPPTRTMTTRNCRAYVAGFFLLIPTLLIQGCADQPMASRSPDSGTQAVIVLPTIEATACQYGGEYPFCRSAPNPDGGMKNPGTEPVSPGESGGDPTPSGSSFTEGSCPASDPACKQPLQDPDKESLAAALQMVDRNAAPVCAQLADKLAELGTAHVFRGAYNSGHTGEAGAGDIHVDARLWNEANSNGGSSTAALAEALLHEAAHLLGWDHPGENRTPYRTFPFDHMFNRDSGVPQCVP